MFRKTHCLVAAVILALLVGEGTAPAGPAPGDVFREYMWYNERGNAGGALRIGGKLGHDKPVPLPHRFDLEHATKAEVVIEKILCHDGTRGLAIQINGKDWVPVPEAEKIPAPQWDYNHHIYPTIEIPLSWLKADGGNEFQMRVSNEHPWKWPQNLIYGVHFRIYYDPAKKPHPTGAITRPRAGDQIGQTAVLACEAQSPNGSIRQVDFVGFYEDVNFEGDGEYRQWHYHFFHGKILHHIGSTSTTPYTVQWDTSWVPDQDQPMKLAARITDAVGLIYMTPAVGNLKLVRPNFSVELCKPYDVPKQWVTRRGRKEQKFNITGDLKHAVAAQLVWSSWSPGYMDGIFINDQRVFDTEGPHYQYYAHRVPLKDLTVLKPGVNTLATGPTPKNQHGMEVNWPGIMVLIQYRKDASR
ncbi:MAG: hypothetical protein N3D11_07575 [Candidatus Sumerlaeia bacterium]|nr:hypothetical protein [Candidatus Sumerlaeia bacterium]